VRGGEDDPVDVPAAGEAPEPLPFGLAVQDREDELHVVLGDGGVRAAQHQREVRVAEEPLLGLGHHEREPLRWVMRERAARLVT
jgi:hypothetical protein